MRRFHWPLQRLLTVTAQRERGLKEQMLDLSRQIAVVRQEIIQRRTVIRMSLSELAEASLDERMRVQEMVLACSAADQQRIDQRQEALGTLDDRRRAASAEFVKMRNKRQTLDRMRADAKAEHTRQELAAEQKQFDETAQIAFGRRASGNIAGG